ncbi:PASTA domain-containing protein [Olsenella massiliensis]|uniref:PASTA domain-containing protein n=1 Tax=Olsenella massiliensis TaxID=1622075 RepID=UPI00071E663B|nr:PASTA domain-containing protein [Olsenella massiliensis]
MPRERSGPSGRKGVTERWGTARTVLAVLLAGTFLCGAVVLATYGLELWGGRTVPDVAFKNHDAAVVALAAKGFVVREEDVPVDDGVGRAVGTDPSAGTRLAAGSEVLLRVGVARVMPDVQGVPQDEARRALCDLGAQDVRLSYRASDAPPGTVISTEPAAGASFRSTDAVTLTVAQALTVPYVVGKTEREARSQLEAVGLSPQVRYVTSADKDQGTVLSCDPIPGSALAAGTTVALVVSAHSPTDYHHLTEYFAYNPRILSGYLSDQGFSLKSNYAADDGTLQALFESDGKGTLVLGSRPYSHTFAVGRGKAAGDLLGQGTPFDGIRLDLPSSELPKGASDLSEAAVSAVMDLCGLTGRLQTVNQDTVARPEGPQAESVSFVCAYGKMGDTCWTVLIANEQGGTRATVTAARTSLYEGVNLRPFGGSVCSFVAYSDACAT